MAALPTFLIIGSQKAGTSWLHHAVSQHPEVVVSTPKELQFFNNRAKFEAGLDWYADHFVPTATTRAIGESTPCFNTIDMLEDVADERRDLVPQRIHSVIPDVRLILLLRDPVERAVSAYYHFLRKQVWPGRPSLTDVGDGRAIISEGHYDTHMTRWLDVFEQEQLLVLVYEEVFRDDASKAAMVKQVFDHIGVDSSFQSVPDKRINRRMSNFALRTNSYPRLVRGGLRRAVPRSVQDRYDWGIRVTAEEREALRREFEPHVERLSAMMGRSFPWLGAGAVSSGSGVEPVGRAD